MSHPVYGVRLRQAMPDPIPVEGPVELIDGKLILRIPLDMGGVGIAAFALGIGEVDSGHLNVAIQPWLAQKLGISPGSIVCVSVDTANGNFRITRSAASDEPLGQGRNYWMLSSSRTRRMTLIEPNMTPIEPNMTPAQITRSIRLGWGGAALSAITTLPFTFIMSSVADTPLIVWAVASAAVTGTLGYGVYRRSRRAAVTLLVLFLISRVWFYLQTGSLGSPLLSIIFLYCFVEGVRGTFAHHRALPNGNVPSGAGAA